MRVYIAGPMTGIKNWNAEAFECAYWDLRSVGHQPINPMHLHGETDETRGSKPRAEYMRVDILALMQCEGICLLPGWQDSTGASLEAEIANQLGLQVVAL